LNGAGIVWREPSSSGQVARGVLACSGGHDGGDMVSPSRAPAHSKPSLVIPLCSRCFAWPISWPTRARAWTKPPRPVWRDDELLLKVGCSRDVLAEIIPEVEQELARHAYNPKHLDRLRSVVQRYIEGDDIGSAATDRVRLESEVKILRRDAAFSFASTHWIAWTPSRRPRSRKRQAAAARKARQLSWRRRTSPSITLRIGAGGRGHAAVEFASGAVCSRQVNPHSALPSGRLSTVC
jgi:hypothetical protein